MSIPSRPEAFGVPDFRNQGVWLRLLLASNGLLLVVALSGNRDLRQLPAEIAELAAVVEPVLLIVLSLLFLLAPRLRRGRRRWVFPVVCLLAAGVTAGIQAFLVTLFGGPIGWRGPLATAAGAALMLAWLDLRARAQAPALTEARLAALTARIRPHFLYNSLNAVLGLLRDDPRRAETTLEEVADLFRALMRDNRSLVPLVEEIALARKYLDIEHLRLGERLHVRWENAEDLPEMMVPPFLLQPLLENAVYHGIEPADVPGEIRIRFDARSRDSLRIGIDNPWLGESDQRHGNRMALDNLRERLMLFYDLEARLETAVRDDRFRVFLDLPKRIPS